MLQDMANVAKVELGRFFQIADELEDYREAKMPSGIIDLFWHELLTDEQEYKSFTDISVGHDVLHAENNGYGELEWVNRYEKRFGKLNKIWFVDTDGNFDSEAYENYLSSGKLIASWDCGPIIPDDKATEVNDLVDRLNIVNKINEIADELNRTGNVKRIQRIDEKPLLDRAKSKIEKFDIEKIRERKK